MSTDARVVIHLLTLKCGPPLDKEPSREEIKLAEWMASILKDFEARQLEVDEYEQLEVEEEEEDWDPQDELMDVGRQTSSGHMITFSGGTLLSEERAWAAAEHHWFPMSLIHVGKQTVRSLLTDVAQQHKLKAAEVERSEEATLENVCYCKAGCSLRFTEFEQCSRLGADPYSSVPLHEQQCAWPSEQGASNRHATDPLENDQAQCSEPKRHGTNTKRDSLTYDSVRAFVQATLLRERHDTATSEGMGAGEEIAEQASYMNRTSSTEIEGSVNVSVLSPKGQHSGVQSSFVSNREWESDALTIRSASGGDITSPSPGTQKIDKSVNLIPLEAGNDSTDRVNADVAGAHFGDVPADSTMLEEKLSSPAFNATEEKFSSFSENEPNVVSCKWRRPGTPIQRQHAHLLCSNEGTKVFYDNDDCLALDGEIAATTSTSDSCIQPEEAAGKNEMARLPYIEVGSKEEAGNANGLGAHHNLNFHGDETDESSANTMHSAPEVDQGLRMPDDALANLRSLLNTTRNEVTFLREIQMANEIEVTKAKSELQKVKLMLAEGEESYNKVLSATQEELSYAQAELAERAKRFDGQLQKLAELKAECSTYEEQLFAESVFREVVDREMEQLRDEIIAVSGKLHESKSALREAERKAQTAEEDLSRHIKCHTEELSSRINELEDALAARSSNEAALSLRLEEHSKMEGSLFEQIRKAAEENVILEEELRNVRSEKSRLLKELQQSKQLYEEKVNEVEKITTAIERSLEVIQCERNYYKKELEATNQRLEQRKTTFQKAMKSLEHDVAATAVDFHASLNPLYVKEEANVIERCFRHTHQQLQSREAVPHSKVVASPLGSVRGQKVEEWRRMEDMCLHKIFGVEKAVASIPVLEVKVEQLKTEADQLREQLKVTNSKLLAEIDAKREITGALLALEKKCLRLDNTKKTVEAEYKQAKERFHIDYPVSGRLKIMDDDLNRRRSTGSAGVSSKIFGEWPSTKIRESAEWVDRQILEKKAYGQSEGLNMMDEISENCRRRTTSLFEGKDAAEISSNQRIVTSILNRRASLPPSMKLPTLNGSSAETEAQEKFKRLERLVEKLTRSTKVKKPRFVEESRFEELRRRCRHQEAKIAELEKVCKEVDDSEEILRKKIAELERRIASQKGTSSRSRTSTSTVPSPVDALPRSTGVDDVFDARHTVPTDSFSCDLDKECSALSSLKPSRISVNAAGCLVFEESAAAPPVTPLSHCEETSTLETCS